MDDEQECRLSFLSEGTLSSEALVALLAIEPDEMRSAGASVRARFRRYEHSRFRFHL